MLPAPGGYCRCLTQDVSWNRSESRRGTVRIAPNFANCASKMPTFHTRGGETALHPLVPEHKFMAWIDYKSVGPSRASDILLTGVSCGIRCGEVAASLPSSVPMIANSMLCTLSWRVGSLWISLAPFGLGATNVQTKQVRTSWNKAHETTSCVRHSNSLSRVAVPVGQRFARMV